MGGPSFGPTNAESAGFDPESPEILKENKMATTSEEGVLPIGGCGEEQAKKLVQEKKHFLQGGYECMFVKEPPDHLQTECPVCLCVLKGPYLIDCCGNSFCKTCIEPVKSDSKPCPLCNVQFTNSMPDKRLQRTLNELQVYCCHKEAGCEWVGELGSLPQHLNLKPQDEGDRLSGCQLVSIECTFCGDGDIQRKDLKEHEEGKCSKRPYSCEYCEDYESTFEDITTNHWPVCPSLPVPCPNECGASPKLGSLDNHVENECPLQLVDCAFKCAGCNERLPRKDIPDHITQSLALHMSLLATSHQQELKKLNGRISDLEMQLEKATELQNQSAAEIAELRTTNQLLQENLDQAQEQAQNNMTHMESQMAGLHNHVGLVPFSFTMPDFEQKKSSNSTWYSPSFYTHPRGYKMCLRVEANGWRDGRKSHVSVYLHMMQGEYDESLKWPFRGNITVQLLNQVGDSGHHAKVIYFTDRADKFCQRLVSEDTEERSPGGWGFHKFICHGDLLPKYLKDNSLTFCIKEVKLKC